MAAGSIAAGRSTTGPQDDPGAAFACTTSTTTATTGGWLSRWRSSSTATSFPVGLWWHVAEALPFGGRDASDAQWQAGVLLLAVMTSGTTDNAQDTVAKLLTGLGWAAGDGQPIDRRTVTGLIATDVLLLRRLGAFERDRRHGSWPGAVTDGGLALARGALADQRS